MSKDVQADLLGGISKNWWEAINLAGGFIGNNPHHKSIVYFLMILDQSNYQLNFHRKQKADVHPFPKETSIPSPQGHSWNYSTSTEYLMNPDWTGADVWNWGQPVRVSHWKPVTVMQLRDASLLSAVKSASCQRASRPPPRQRHIFY